MYFPSKKDYWFTLIIWGTILVIFIPAIISDEFVGMLIGLPIAGFIGWFWFSTGYTIQNGSIKVKFGPFKKTINIQEISKINKTKNPFSAPALAIDRLEIIHGRFFDFVHVSPVNECEFIRLLIKENPNIALDAQLKRMLEDGS